METGNLGILPLRYTWEDDWLGRWCGDELGSERRQWWWFKAHATLPGTLPRYL